MIRECGLASHIVAHSLAVAKLAVFLAKQLKAKSICVDTSLVEAACLLHDIARPCDFEESDCSAVAEQDKVKWRQLKTKYDGLCHEDIAYEILSKDYPELATTIKKHKYIAILDEKERPSTWEEKLVYYADKRVMHDRIVSLRQRLDDGHKRNVHLNGTKGRSDINTAEVDLLILELEDEIFGKLDLNPLEVTDEFIDSC